MRFLYFIDFLLLLSATSQAGAIYKYVEKNGTIVYTNVLPSGVHSRQVKRLKGNFRAAPARTVPARITKTTSKRLGRYERYIQKAARKYHIPANLVRAVMHAESAFNPRALSPVGAAGLMQLMPKTARAMFVKDIFDAQQSIDGGVRYLRLLANEFNGDMIKIVAAYNAGPEAVKKYNGRVPPYAETQAYVRKVVKLYFQYKKKMQYTTNAP